MYLHAIHRVVQLIGLARHEIGVHKKSVKKAILLCPSSKSLNEV